jgi:hypothetical protein
MSVVSMVMCTPIVIPIVIMVGGLVRVWMCLRSADRALKSHGPDGVAAMAGFVKAMTGHDPSQPPAESPQLEQG